MKLLKFTGDDRHPVYVNPRYIVAMERRPYGGTKILLEGITEYVKEDLNVVSLAVDLEGTTA